MYSDKDSSRPVRRPVRRKANPGKKPGSGNRKLIEKAVSKNPRLTPQEVKAVLDIQGSKVPLDEIIWVKSAGYLSEVTSLKRGMLCLTTGLS